MPEESEKTTTPEKKKQKNIALILAIAVLVGVGAYYFINQNNMNKASNDVKTAISQAPDKDSSGSDMSTSTSELTSKKWTWVNTKMNDGAITTPSKAGVFTATFQEDGRLVATTDCNNGNGSYEVGENNSLTIGPMATTMMFCEGSSQDAYFQQLGNVGSYKISDGQLWLMIKMDSGTMIFE